MSGIYTVKLDLPSEEALALPRDRAIIWVSINGGRDFEGERLGSWVAWAKDNFREVWMDIADTDKAVNYTAFQGYAPEEAWQISRSTGDLWLATHGEIVSTIPQSRRIRFEHWLNDPGFNPLYADFQGVYDNTPVFAQAVNDEAGVYAAKQGKPEKRDDCVEYILKEITASSLRAKRFKAVCLYPGKQKRPFAMIRNREIIAPDDLAYEVYAPVSIRRHGARPRNALQ